MKSNWSMDEIIEHFTLLPTELQSLRIKDQHNQFGKALLLKIFHMKAGFRKAQMRYLRLSSCMSRNS